MKHTLTATLTIFSLLLTTRVAMAQESAAQTTDSQNQEIEQNIKERVEKVKQQVDEKVKGIVSARDSQVFGLIGTLEKVVGSSLQVRTFDNTLRVVELEKDAVLLRSGKTFQRQDLELNSSVLLMGYVDTNGAYGGRRLVISDSPALVPAQQTTGGTYESSTTKQITVQLLGSQNSTSVPITTKTQFMNRLGKTMKRTDLKAGDTLVIVKPEAADASSSATRIYSLTTEPQTATATPTP